MNLILATDSYKVTHARQYPPKTTNVYSYLESRGGKYPETVFFGLQYLLKRYLANPVTLRDLYEASAILEDHFGGKDYLNHKGWNHIIRDHAGHLPLSIRAVPEGTVSPVKSVLMTVENTCPECYWLTNYAESLLVQSWYPITVATASRAVKKTIKTYLERTGDPREIDFKLHDFGYRGVSSNESASIGGAAHLVNFRGSDTLVALKFLRDYYSEQCGGYSIPASEHSTITSWGQEHEVDAYRNMLEIYPDGLVACVSDSFDIYNACANLWGKELKDKVLNRNGCLVVRPDSGYPPHVVRDVVDTLFKAFGGSHNSKGFKVLNPHVRVIQGDGVTPDTIEEILHQLQFNWYSADNVAFGMGGGLLQKMDRDTQKFAFKCSSVVVDGVQRDVFKNPVTDPGKVSKAGRFDNLNLPEVFRNGKILIDQSLSEIRERAKL